MSLADKVKHVRKNEFNLNQTEFGKLLGISRNYVTEIENGRVKGNAKLLKSLSEVTGKSIEWFISDSDDDTINIKPFEVLDNIIDSFIENGVIDGNGVITVEEAESFLHATLLKEIKHKVSLINDNKN